MIATSLPSYYEILGVPAQASDDQIRSAYEDRLTVMESRGEPEADRALLLEAMEILTDPDLRQEYDRLNPPSAPLGDEPGPSEMPVEAVAEHAREVDAVAQSVEMMVSPEADVASSAAEHDASVRAHRSSSSGEYLAVHAPEHAGEGHVVDAPSPLPSLEISGHHAELASTEAPVEAAAHADVTTAETFEPGKHLAVLVREPMTAESVSTGSAAPSVSAAPVEDDSADDALPKFDFESSLEEPVQLGFAGMLSTADAAASAHKGPDQAVSFMPQVTPPQAPAPEAAHVPPPLPPERRHGVPMVAAEEAQPKVIARISNELHEAQRKAEEQAIANAEAALAKVAAKVRDVRTEPKPKGVELGPDTVFSGELIRKIREAKSLTLQRLAEQTRITMRHLENIEADRYPELPATVYLRGMLMNLARELALDPLRVSKTYLMLVAEATKRTN